MATLQKTSPSRTGAASESARLVTKLSRTMLATVGEWRLIEEGDRILVALSGGKDSYTMLDLLWRARRKSPVDFEIVAFHLDQQQPGYDGRVLKDWLENKPDSRLLSLWKEYVGHIWGRFTDDEQIQMRQNLIGAVENVANAAGGFLGLSKISGAEREVIEDLQKVVS